MSETTQLQRAVFRILSGQREEIPVLFNPESLEYTVSSTIKRRGRSNETRQFVSKTPAKLTMTLVFDTTTTGKDVRQEHTAKIERFMKGRQERSTRRQRVKPPKVLFVWGTLKFEGVAESYKETIDYFSPDGVPLRATINLTLSSQESVFEVARSGGFEAATAGELERDAVRIPTGNRESPASIAQNAGGDSIDTRTLAAANGEETPRFSTGDFLVVSESVSLRPPAAFAAGVAVAAGAGDVARASVGGAASARVSASAGAFTGLRSTARRRRTATFDLDRLRRASESVGLATDSGASFSLGGQATVRGSTSLRTDVGLTASLQSRIQFEE